MVPSLLQGDIVVGEEGDFGVFLDAALVFTMG